MFLTWDTELGQRLYAYCDGDPINFSDPSGHEGDELSVDGEVGIGAGFLVGGATVALSILFLPVTASVFAVAALATVGYIFVSVGIDLIVGGFTRMERKGSDAEVGEFDPPSKVGGPGVSSSSTTYTLWTWDAGAGVWHNSGSSNQPFPNTPRPNQAPNPHD